jgi:two-component system cell cycle response regulator
MKNENWRVNAELGGRILVIEDNLINLELITYLLKSFSYTVLSATNGDEGIDLAHSQRVDLIICDVHLPGMDGYQVARRLKEHPVLRNIPLVAVTALAMMGDREKALAAGFNSYISKPIIPENFIKQIEEVIRNKRQGTGQGGVIY